MPTAKSRRRRRVATDPRQMSGEELARVMADCERRIDVMEAFETSEEWRLLSGYLDGRTKRLENEGKGLRRRLMRPLPGQPTVTLEQIAAHEARIDETGFLRRSVKTILALWRDQIQELQTIRAESTR